ncbi:carboxymuconolactone decarboxylase family protein [Hymenobacter ginsengisoli]|uniref:Carboxymuconolactone decarboxylase family protein n=1 Tax=Hymenobacter ginsengisoli TaxID=1051626 RepID=A0ABP8PZP3_9BACT|nr:MULTISPECIES: carboxymuconolactone decarboxylase family protein [unclassified Hymenobacter]MBO2030661.1 carboxymuconolactone decarboxylase family protein [Hymenobacter sp. BT559]
MATFEDNLGGRLALLSRDKLNSDQKKLYDQLQDTMVPWAKKSGFQADTFDDRLIGPFNAMLRSPAISKALMGVTAAEGKETSLSEKVRQVVILTVGAAWQAAYELYAHVAVGKKAGFDEATLQALVAGQKPTGLNQEERVAYDFTHRLVTTHQIEAELYEQAIVTFGEKGVVDMIYLAGQYMTVSGLLNTFAVPAPPAQ